MKLAYVFAGQGRRSGRAAAQRRRRRFLGGAQRPSRPQLELAAALPGGAELLQQAAVAAGLDSRAQLLAGGGRALDRTSVLQPTVVAVSLAIARALPEPDLAAGQRHLIDAAHSAGGSRLTCRLFRLAGLSPAAPTAWRPARSGCERR